MFMRIYLIAFTYTHNPLSHFPTHTHTHTNTCTYIFMNIFIYIYIFMRTYICFCFKDIHVYIIHVTLTWCYHPTDIALCLWSDFISNDHPPPRIRTLDRKTFSQSFLQKQDAWELSTFKCIRASSKFLERSKNFNRVLIVVCIKRPNACSEMSCPRPLGWANIRKHAKLIEKRIGLEFVGNHKRILST